MSTTHGGELPERERITLDDPRIIHRTRNQKAVVVHGDDELFYVFSVVYDGDFRWTYAFKSRSAALREARRLAGVLAKLHVSEL